MCEMASFIWKRCEAAGVEVCTHDLTSHANTYDGYPGQTEKTGWYEGHYKLNGEIQCRTPDGTDQVAEDEIRRRYPTVWDFITSKWPASVTRLDLSGATIPASLVIPASVTRLDLSGATVPAGLVIQASVTTLDLRWATILASLVIPASVTTLDLYGATVPASLVIPATCQVIR